MPNIKAPTAFISRGWISVSNIFDGMHTKRTILDFRLRS